VDVLAFLFKMSFCVQSKFKYWVCALCTVYVRFRQTKVNTKRREKNRQKMTGKLYLHL